MLKQAEENATLDQSKKSLANILYETDNMLLKIESVIQNSSTYKVNKLVIEILKEIKQFYTRNDFSKLYSISLILLDYCYTLFLVEFISKN